MEIPTQYFYYAANFACKILNVFFHRINLVLLNLQLSIFENTVDPEQPTLIELHAYK